MIERLGTDPWENTAESLTALNDTLWGPAYLSDMDFAYCPAYAINAIITEADVRIKKKWSRLGFFSSYVAVDVYGPNPRKNTGSYPFQKTRYA